MLGAKFLSAGRPTSILALKFRLNPLSRSELPRFSRRADELKPVPAAWLKLYCSSPLMVRVKSCLIWLKTCSTSCTSFLRASAVSWMVTNENSMANWRSFLLMDIGPSLEWMIRRLCFCVSEVPVWKGRASLTPMVNASVESGIVP